MRHKIFIALALVIYVMPGLILFNACSTPGPQVESRAAIIDQLYVVAHSQTFIDNATAALENYGFKVDCYKGDEITVDFYRKLPELGYKLIVFRAHSGLLGNGGKAIPRTCLFTNEPYNQTTHISDQLSDRLAKARIDENHPWVFGIGADFVRRSMQGSYNHTFVIMMGCSTLYIQDLAQSFLDKGASTYIGWDATVGLEYVDDVTLALLEKVLSNNVSIDVAIAGTMQEKGPDPDFGAVLKYYPIQSGEQTIAEFIR